MATLDFMMSARLQRVLGAVMTAPERELTLSDLIRIGGSGKGATQAVVAHMLKAGIVTDRRLANLRLFKANVEHPLFPELRALSVKAFGVGDRLREVVETLGDKAEMAFVFGSFAAGADVAESDVDVMLVGTADLFEVMEVLVPAEKDLGRKVHVNVYDPVEWREARRDKVVARILAGPKIVLKGDCGDGGPGRTVEEPREDTVPKGGDAGSARDRPVPRERHRPSKGSRVRDDDHRPVHAGV
ncbi:nucleotidyltransferase domain-containing protein [Methylobacterium sp. WL64]|uniref:nucleotidyltransferase domain-containing protein n=1 Tax=Methylobacterium sp. WL64 TaxID=2603894 RepID=UPI0011C9DDD9|nr:nucleotidyltransferase domain-containing protein [Methylobacterium sp. WL64]TXN02407.1 nucleotidyltransferase domain-containing protein [Methylobacterium sp. WL64]